MEEDHISRSSILYGSTNEELWFDLEQFYREHLSEINHKLTQLDDEIWGKIIMMERNKRIAKAYLRTTTVVIDGSCYGFDGRTIGFNSFENPFRDTHVEEMKMKIGEGVILKMDCQGNIIAMARGTSPVFVQGARAGRDGQCYGEKVGKLKGRLETLDPSGTSHRSNRERAVKVFDMKVFKAAVDQELYHPYPNRRELLYKTCIRMALVKEDKNPLKVPCWFMIINLVAIDMLNAKVPLMPSSPTQTQSFLSNSMGGGRRRSESGMLESEGGTHLSQSNADLYGTLTSRDTTATTNAAAAAAATLSQLLAAGANPLASSTAASAWAALQQHLATAQNQQQQNSPPLLPPSQGVPTPDQLAQLANNLALGLDPNKQGARPHSHWKKTPSGYMSESDSAVMNRRPAKMSRSAPSITQQCRWGGLAQSMDSLIYEPLDLEDDDDLLGSNTRLNNFSLRPKPPYRPDPAPPPNPHAHAPHNNNPPPKKLFPSSSTSLYGTFKPSTWSNGSTSDYESTKEIYDSSTCSSSSRSSNSAAGRSSSPSIVSETASDSPTSDFGYLPPPQPTHPPPPTPLRPNRTLDDIPSATVDEPKPKHHVPPDAPVCQNNPSKNLQQKANRGVHGTAPSRKSMPAPPPPPPPTPPAPNMELPPQPIYDYGGGPQQNSVNISTVKTKLSPPKSGGTCNPKQQSNGASRPGSKQGSRPGSGLDFHLGSSPGVESSGDCSNPKNSSAPKKNSNNGTHVSHSNISSNGHGNRVANGHVNGKHLNGHVNHHSNPPTNHHHPVSGHSKFLLKARRLLSKSSSSQPSKHEDSSSLENECGEGSNSSDSLSSLSLSVQLTPSPTSNKESSEYDTNPDSSSGEGEQRVSSLRPSPFKRSPPVPPVRRRRNTKDPPIPSGVSIVSIDPDTPPPTPCSKDSVLYAF